MGSIQEQVWDIVSMAQQCERYMSHGRQSTAMVVLLVAFLIARSLDLLYVGQGSQLGEEALAVKE